MAKKHTASHLDGNGALDASETGGQTIEDVLKAEGWHGLIDGGAARLLDAVDNVPLSDDALFDDMEDDALAEVADSMRREAERLSQMSGKARYTLERRLKDRGATALDTEHWTGKIELGAWQIIDESKLHLLPPDIFAKCYVTPEPKPPVGRFDNRALNEARKLGGKVAEIIDASRHRGEGSLTLERKREVAE